MALTGAPASGWRALILQKSPGEMLALPSDLFMLNALWIFIGGGLGSVARWWLSGFVAEAVGQTFPWGTLIVNLSGSFLIGLFATVAGSEGRWFVSPSFRQFFMFGICGGYTTFSSFSLQTLNLAQEREWLYAAANVLLSVVTCLLAVWLGHLLAMNINKLAR